MNNVISNIKYDLLLQTTKLSAGNMIAELDKDPRKSNIILRPTTHICFVICNSCYWSATYFSIDDLESSSKVLSCHVCNSHNTDLIPILSNESFRIYFNVTRGMEIEFYRSNEIVDRQQESPEQQIVPVSLV